MADYRAVQDALKSGADPAMLCATCPWDRYCVSPPTMTSAGLKQMQDAAAKDDATIAAARAEGRDPGMPTATLLTALTMGTRDLQAYVCPVSRCGCGPLAGGASRTARRT